MRAGALLYLVCNVVVRACGQIELMERALVVRGSHHRSPVTARLDRAAEAVANSDPAQRIAARR